MQLRELNGRYSRNELSTRTKIKILFSLVVLTAFLVWFVPVQLRYNAMVANGEVNATTSPVVIDLTPIKIRAAQDKLLDKLSLGCETFGVKEPDGAIILDNNKEISVGRFMFQPKTVQYYVKRFEGKTLNRHDAIVYALDATSSKELARRIIFEVGAIEGNWKNCSARHQLKSQVELLREFQTL